MFALFCLLLRLLVTQCFVLELCSFAVRRSLHKSLPTLTLLQTLHITPLAFSQEWLHVMSCFCSICMSEPFLLCRPVSVKMFDSLCLRLPAAITGSCPWLQCVRCCWMSFWRKWSCIIGGVLFLAASIAVVFVFMGYDFWSLAFTEIVPNSKILMRKTK